MRRTSLRVHIFGAVFAIAACLMGQPIAAQTPVSVEVFPQNPTIYDNQMQQFDVFVTFSDGSTSGGSSLSVGGNHSCVVLATGAIMCWGHGGNGQLGNGSFSTSATPVQVSGISNATMVAAGNAHTCARRSDGTVWCWGYNGYGQLGSGSFTNSSLPVQVSGVSNATSLTTGYFHSCARLADSTVKCWGRGYEGQLGSGASGAFAMPQSVTGISSATQVAAEDYRTCARLVDGTLRCWGYGPNGELGNGTTTSGQLTPVQVSGIANATSVSVGGSHTCARLSDGTVKCWGYGGNGQLGNGSTASSSTPVQVSNISSASSIDAGYSHTCARMTDATVQCWGYNFYGQLGNGGSSQSNVPVTANISNVSSVSAGSLQTCARLADSTVRCWGYGGNGELGNGSFSTSLVPVMVTGITNAAAGGGAGSVMVAWTSSNHSAATVDQNGLATAVAAGNITITADVAGVTGDTTLTVIPVPVLASISISPENPTIFDGQTQQFFASGTLSDGTPVTTESAMAASYNHTCTVHAGGSVSCWGYGGNGQLGNGSFGVSAAPVSVSNISNATSVAAGANHSCARLADGTVWCWGYNGNGQLGNGTTTQSPTPVQVSGINSAIAVSAGDNHSCARLTDGSIHCWGHNGQGQLGNGNFSSSLAPVQVNGISTATQLSSDGNHSCARLLDGTVQCWGYNFYGQLGNGAINTQSNVPVAVSGVMNATSVAAGAIHSCARLANGTVKCWGYNGNGQIGDGNFATYSPVPAMVAGISGATSVDAGAHHSCARLSDGTAKCWGYNYYGGLGNGSVLQTSPYAIATPVAVTGISSATSIVTGGYHTCARLADASLSCWGYNYHGALGSGSVLQSPPYGVPTPASVIGINDAAAGSGGSYLDGLAWSSSDPGVATIDANGLATAQSPGTTTIYATVDDVVGSTTLTVVTNAPIANDQSFSTLDNTALNIHPGYTDPDGDSLTFTLTTSPQHGFITGTAPDLTYTPTGNGSHSDDFSYQVCDVFGACDTATVHINLQPTLATITITPANPSIMTGQTQQFSASGTFTDGSNFQPGGGSTVSGGISHTCALLTDGTVKCWGYSGNGQLGHGVFDGNIATPVMVTGMTSAVAISAGHNHTCAALAGGTVKCWGYGGSGQLGNGSFSSSATPVQVSGISNAVAVAGGAEHSCAVLANGSVKCWGYNGYGNLGNGTFNGGVATPVSVSGLSNATSITNGAYHTCAGLADGSVKCWGNGGNGQMGNGAFANSNVPVSVSGISNATGVTAGYYHACASLSDGAAKCWGYSTHGQLGPGIGMGSQTATPVTVTGLNATAVSAGCHHTCALLGDGTLRCWGYNGAGGLGNGTFSTTSSLVAVNSISTATSIGMGYTHSCARLADGTLRCWGNGGSGQLGNGNFSSTGTPVQVSGITNAAAGMGGSGLGNGLAGLVWSSSDTGVATINGNGLASGLTGGATTIKATVGSIFGTTTLTVISPDFTPPVITPTVTGTLGNNGWYTSDAGITWNVQDPETAFTTSGCGASSVTTDTTGVTFNCSATSTGGSASQSVTIKRDATAPIITFVNRTAANGNGWNNTDVTANWTCSDATSGAASANIAETLTVEGANQSLTGACSDQAGNSATDTQTGINIDKTAPTAAASASPALNANGWNNIDVTVSFSGNDGLYGLASCTADVVLATEAAGQSASGTCTDAAGNISATATAAGINIDKTAPTLNFGAPSPAPNGDGWNNTDVAIGHTANDNLSGISAALAPSTTITGEGMNLTAQITVTDDAGNSATFNTPAVNIDRTAPSINGSRAPLANANGWNNTAVTVSFACSDPLSGLAAGSPPSNTVLNGEGAAQSVPGACTDAAGNTASATVTSINIDKTAPSATGTPSRATDSNGWYNHSFNVTWSGSDALSGVASCSAVSTYNAPDTGSGSLGGSCSDMAGNTGNASFAFMFDSTPPVITLTTPPVGASYLLNASVAANYSCADALSSVASCAGTTANGANINTASVGSKTFAVNAADMAGNPAVVSRNYSVQYNFIGFHQPIDALPVINQAKPGRTIPVKWTLLDANGNVISDLGMFGSLLSAPIACDASPSAIVEEQLTSPGSTVLRFDATANQFIYNWQSASGWRGCRLLQLTLSDGTQHFAKFNFK